MTIDDAQKVGACSTGIKSWLNKHEIGQTSIPMSLFLKLVGNGKSLREEQRILTKAIERQPEFFTTG